MAEGELLNEVLGPKRRRGKTAAPPTDKPPQRQRAPRLPKAVQAKGVLATSILLADGLAAFLVPKYWTQEDRLALEETTLLVGALYDELAQYPSVINWLVKAAQLNAHARLLAAVTVIAAPRLARHGVIPREAGWAIAATAGGLVEASAMPPSAPGAGGASRDSGPDEDREERPGQPAPVMPAVRRGVSKQAGLGQAAVDLSGSEDYPDGRYDEEPEVLQDRAQATV